MQRSTRRRLSLFTVVMLLILGSFVGRLIDVQVVRADELNEEAYARRSIPVPVYGVRGNILDSNGLLLAESVERFNITAAPSFVKGFNRYVVDEVTGTRSKIPVSAEQAFAELAGVTGEDVDGIRTRLTSNPQSNFAYVAKGVDVEVLRQVRSLGIPWIYSELAPARSYPNGAVGGNLTGFLGTDGPGAGVELYMDHCLAADDGSETYERGADGVRLPGSTVTTKEAVNGSDVILTIDSDLQWFAQQAIAEQAKELRAEWAIAIVMEVKTGKLKAVAEYPAVDPNSPGSTDSSTWTSRSFTAPFEPGSSLKPLAIASLLDEGVISTVTPVTAPYSYEPEKDVKITDAFYHEPTRWTAAGVLTRSSNVGMFKLAEMGTQRELYERYRAFGLGERSEVGFQGESKGILHNVTNWDRQTRYNVVVGQGVSVTAIQLASIYQAIGNDGVRLPVSLVEGCRSADGTLSDTPATEGTRVISSAAASGTLTMLETTVREGALGSRISLPGYRIGAKTGTGLVAERGVYGRERVTSIAGLIPVDDPQYAIVVIMGKPQTSRTSVAVAPAFRKIMSQVVKTYRVEPSGSGGSSLPTTW